MLDEKPNILLIEDNPADQDLIKEHLDDIGLGDITLTICDTLRDGLQVLEENNKDMVLLDLSLPDSFGLDGMIKMLEKHPHLPLIILTGQNDSSTAIEAIRNGAQDYLIKGKYNETILERTIRYSIERHRTVLEIAKQAKLLDESRNKALEAQSRLMSAQLNPHFIFNALNSMQFYVLDQNIEDGLDYISSFSKLMRRTLENSRFNYIPISEEVDFLKIYLDLEKKRFSDSFDYSISLADDIDATKHQIPPMILQPYVENAIVHGIGNKDGNGHIKIHFQNEDRRLKCEIIDDGVGRRAASNSKKLKQPSSHESMSGSILNKKIEILNQLEKGRFDISIQDRYQTDNLSTGTIVTIWMPLNS